uniref:Vitellogenin domain-containing protein n=1 Tax=Esox lucius TaxID=8010 RepID=A0A6Q2YN66_ESOLU
CVCSQLCIYSCGIVQGGNKLSARFRTFKKYVYHYTTESKNGVTGKSNLSNGPKVTCQVELEVPQECSFVLHTVDCALSEVSLIDTQEGVVYRQAAGAEAFKAAMEKNPLKITWDPVTGIRLYPELDEPVNILNIKRGIISALNVPVMEEERNSLMDTVHGLCKTDYMVNTRKDTDTQLTLTRDLSQCDQFRSMKLPSSPLTLLPSLHGPLSKLIRSTQDCIYQFDNKRKHMTNAVCTEMHIFLPFSHNNSGIFSVVTQNLILQDSAKINNKVFEAEVSHIKPLHMEYPEDKASAQTKDALLRTLRDLNALSSTGQGQRRPGLFQKLVSELRSLKNKTLSLAMEEMMGESSALTWQALTQCGTPECTSAILQVIKTMDSSAVVRDAIVYALSLQPSPDAHRVRDMLSLAQHKQSKSIMYALANTVRKFHPGHQTPEVKEVSKFVHTLLGDCSGDEDMTFLTLRIVGVMGKAMQSTWDVSKGMKEALINCVKKGTSLSVQKAAMQAFRLMDMDQEVRETLLEEYQDAEGPVQKRVAAYLMLFKTPDRALLSNVITTLKGEQDPQFKSFVVSHLDNIRHSDDPKMQQIKLYIKEALQDYWHPANQFSTMSRNYKMDTAMGSIKGNIIFDSTDILPKEVLFETTLNAFGYNTDMIEFGIEGNGFNPTLEALFGEQGFFPDSVSKAMFWAGDKMPDVVQRVLEKWIAPLRSERRKRQELIRNIGHNFQKLVRELHSQDSPEAMAYLRILGDEVGYIKSSEIENMAQAVAMYSDVLFKIIPLKSLISNTDNKLYAHYIFLDERFSLPSMSGLPLKFSLSGVFSPGAKGGLNLSPGMVSCLVFFITQMGIHIPEFVVAGIEMRTNMYHESSLNTKVTISRNKIKLSIPAPKETTELFSISNKLMSVSSTQTKLVPSFGEGTTDSIECKPLFTGMNICTTMHYASASSTDEAPYYPLTGESRLAVEIQPIGQVTEYTAAITSETLREGKEGRQKIDSLKLTLRAEGDEPMEATATVKYNRNKNTLTTEVQIPDYDIEAGITLAVTDSNIKGKKMRGILLDVTNHNIPQLSLVGRARLESMKNGMLQIQISFPALSSDVSASATLKKSDGLVMQLETAVNIPVMSSVQKVIVRYDENKFEVEMKSDLDSEIQKFIPNLKYYQKHLQNLIDELLDQKVAKTDMKVRHIVTKAIEASNIWLDKVAGRNKRSLSELTLPTVPEKLFIKSDSLFRYQFNTEKIAISLPVPLGGKSSEELKFPTTLSIPAITIPKMNWMIPPMDIKIPTFTIPRSLDFMLPLLGLAEMTSKVNSNFYNWEASISGGNNTVDVPSYIAQYKVIAQCPVSPLSYRLEGTGMISGTMEDNLKYVVNGSLSHSFIDASFSIFKTLSVKDKLNIRASYKIEASSPLGLQTSMYYSAKSESSSKEVKGDGNLDASIRVGSLTADSTCSHNYAIRPLHREGRGEFNLRVNSPLIQAQNVIKGNYANNELSIVSKTNVQDNALKHVAELMYKDAQLSLKCDTVYNVLGSILNNNAELGISSNIIILRVESQADDLTNQAYSLLTGTLNSDGLEVNSEGLLTFKDGRGLHKATVTLDINGLVTSGINSLQCSPLTFENIYNGGIDSRGASVTSTTKGMVEDGRAELSLEGRISSSEAFLHSGFKVNIYDSNARSTINLALNRRGLTFSNHMKGFLQKIKTENTHSLTVTLWTLVFRSKTENFICEDAYYKHDLKVNVKPFVTSVDMNNDLKLFDIHMSNEGQVKMEPTKVDLTGSARGAYGNEHELRHTYEVNFADLAGNLKYSTTGKIMESQISHNCKIEIAGFTSKTICEAKLNSESVRFDSSIRTLALPFSFTVNAIIDSDGEVDLFGKHTGQLYSKLLVKAEPLALAYSHDCRSSTTHVLKRVKSFANLNNKFEVLLTPSEQSMTLKTISKFNNHAYNQDFSTYNTAEKLGIEFAGLLSTKLLISSRGDRDKRYDKNSDSHIIELPFIKNLPTALELLRTTIKLEDSNVAWLGYIDGRFGVKEKLHKKISELKKVIETFDITIFFQDLRDFILSINFAKYVENLTAQIPTEKMASVLESMKDVIVNWIEEYEIPDKINVVYSYIRDLLLRYEFDQRIEIFIDETVVLINEFRIQETVQSLVDALRSINFEVIALYLINIPDLTFPEITILEIKLPSTNLPKLNLDNFEITILPIPEFKFPQVPTEFQIPAFGKLYGEFRVNSPHYTLVTAVTLENSTTININRKKRGALERSKFSAILTSQAKSTLDFLDYSLDAIALLEASQMETMVFTETVKVTHKAFSIDHEGSLTFSAPSAEAIAKTTAKATTEMYTADLQNNIALSLKSGISASIGSIYNHNVNIAAIGMSSQLTMSQTAAATLESGIISLTAKTEGGGKWSIQDYSDEGTHKSNVELNINVSTAKLTFFGETDSKILKIKNTINAESVIFSHFTVDARTETELPFIKSSVLILNGNAHIGDVKIVLTASHNAELMGRMSGTISNTLEFLARPFEIVFDCKNNGNGKVVFPLKLTGRFDLENDFGVIFNSEIQNVNWASLARFNQYTYYTNFTMVNHQKDIAIYAAMNGEANLDFLTIPLTIPEMTVPYLNMKTPHIKELSLWTHVGLKELLTTPQQSFDMNLKLQYQKNPDMHTVHYDLQNFYNAISNLDTLRHHFELWRDKLVTILANSYNEAKIHFDKFKIDNSDQPPKYVTIPGYKIPVLNIKVSSFRAELPLPILHIPETLRELTLPLITLPAIQNNIMIPAMGNMTFNFSFKSTVITLTANAGLYNQSDIIVRFGSTSTSVFNILKGKIDGSTSLTRSRGLKLATAFSWEHQNIEGSHNCTVNLSKRSMETSLVTIAKVNLPFTSLELIQDYHGNTKTKPNDGISISVASPSVGFLGLLITRRSSSQVYGKLFSRYLSTPDKDTDIVSVKAALKNSENLSFQVVWNMDYHTAHFAHNDISKVLDTLQNTLRVMFTNAADSIPSINITELSDTFVSVLMFLHETNFTLPWIEERLSGQEIYEKASRSVSAATKGAVQRFSNLMDAITDIIERYIKGIQFTMPSSNVVINGNQIVANLRSALSVVKGQITEATRILEDVSLEELIQKVNSLLQLNLQRARDFLASLKTLDMEEMLNSLERYMHVARSQASKYNDYAKVKIQEIYNKVTMEQMNNDLTELVNILQSYYFRALNGFIDLMRQASQSAAPYIKITTKKLDVDIPLPFFWRSFNEWPEIKNCLLGYSTFTLPFLSLAPPPSFSLPISRTALLPSFILCATFPLLISPGYLVGHLMPPTAISYALPKRGL